MRTIVGLGGRVIELSEMIRELRRELTAAISEGDGERVRFELGPVEIEASVTVSKEAGGDAKLRFWLADTGAAAKLARADTQRITFTLHPRLADSGASPLISGDDVPHER
ncbi:trypco2 family protein [Streptomyces platensis]|uniref:trypco2 family protein n=1 Tax=Streptomyces platensis TaxID=58346 RepID=UPI002254C231|nr:trypco2 family protein [Streptomyces platensis]